MGEWPLQDEKAEALAKEIARAVLKALRESGDSLAVLAAIRSVIGRRVG